MKTKPKTPQQEAIDQAAKAAGGMDALAVKLGIARRSLFYWRNGRMPAERAIELEQAIGIPRHVLRPDLWPEPPAEIVGVAA